MRSSDAESAALEVTLEQCAEHGDAVGVECGQRLIENPQRSPRQLKPRKSDAPLLSLRQHTDWQCALLLECDDVECLGERGGG